MELLSSETARWMIAAWFLFLGGAVGSFLNVVVYRLPEGMSISWPGSHCPLCKHAIRPYDNIPVLAWLWLQGRCRDCRRPISFRYPLVEAVTAGLFLWMLTVEVLGGGHNLPVRIPPLPAELHSLAKPLSLCLLHLGLLCTLLAAALIRWDGKSPPRGLFVPVLLAGLVAPPIWPWLHPVAAEPGLSPAAAATHLSGAVDSLLGLGTGFFMALAAAWLSKRLALMGKPGGKMLGEALVIGVVMGWQAVFLLAPLAMLLEELSRLAAAFRWKIFRRFAAGVWIAPLTLFWILNWAQLAALLPFKVIGW